MEGVRIKSLEFDESGGCKVDTEGRTIEFYGSVFGNRDSVGDVVVKGAFKKSIRERWPKKLIKVFRNHTDAVGMPIELKEDDYGLFCRAKMDRTLVGDECLAQCESGTLAHASFMYRIMKWKRVDAEDGVEELHLTELKLIETGPVHWPANELAVMLAVQKSGRPSHAALVNFALADLLEPAKAALAIIADRDHHNDYERREISALLKDLAPFVDRLRAIEMGEGGPDPLKGTTREEKAGEPEPVSATTPEATKQLADRVGEALQAMQRLQRIQDRWAA